MLFWDVTQVCQVALNTDFEFGKFSEYIQYRNPAPASSVTPTNFTNFLFGFPLSWPAGSNFSILLRIYLTVPDHRVQTISVCPLWSYLQNILHALSLWSCPHPRSCTSWSRLKSISTSSSACCLFLSATISEPYSPAHFVFKKYKIYAEFQYC